MVKVVIKAKIKGRKEIKIPMYANTLSDFLILTEDVAKKIDPEILGYEEEIEVGGGGIIKGKVCLVKLKVEDPKTKEEREEQVEAVILKGERYCVLGHETLERLRVKINPTTGEFEFI
jgi:predicted aspartyl protease